MAFDLEEQEQIEQLKAFWSRWGNWIVGLMTVAIISVLGWKAYDFYQVKQSEQASQLYTAYMGALEKKDAGAQAQLEHLQKDFVKSRYTALASLNAAGAAMMEQQWDKAQAPLQWLMANGTAENQAVARLQLADVLAQLGKTDNAIKTLDTLPLPEFTAAFANKKADVYLLANDNAKARESLSAALKWIQAQPTKNEQLVKEIQYKLDLLPS